MFINIISFYHTKYWRNDLRSRLLSSLYTAKTQPLSSSVAARFVFSRRAYSEHTTPPLRDLHWLRVPQRIGMRSLIRREAYSVRYGMTKTLASNRYISVSESKCQRKQAVGGRPPRYMPPPRPASGDTIYVIWSCHHYCMSMLACQYQQPKRFGDFDL